MAICVVFDFVKLQILQFQFPNFLFHTESTVAVCFLSGGWDSHFILVGFSTVSDSSFFRGFNSISNQTIWKFQILLGCIKRFTWWFSNNLKLLCLSSSLFKASHIVNLWIYTQYMKIYVEIVKKSLNLLFAGGYYVEKKIHFCFCYSYNLWIFFKFYSKIPQS